MGSSFDPLTPPGNDRTLPVVNVASGIVPGKIAVIGMDNAAFFKKRPKGDANPDKLLSRGTQVKVISVDGSYLKVELNNGAVGYVPAMMVEDPNSRPSPNEIQVYPPTSGPGAVPIVPLAPGVPGGAGTPPPVNVPEVIDPDAAPDPVPAPAPAPAPDAAPTPAPPPVPGDLGTPSPPIKKDGE